MSSKWGAAVSVSFVIGSSYVYVLSRCFAVELFAGTNMALHMSVRFGYTGDYQLVMNSLDCGVWGSETRHCNPFHIGAHFHLKIKAHRSHYKVHRLEIR